MADQTIFARLKEDHDNHRTLLDLIDKTRGDSEGRQDLFGNLKTEVTAHAAAEDEEEMFVKAAKGLSDQTEKDLAKKFEQRKPDELERAE